MSISMDKHMQHLFRIAEKEKRCFHPTNSQEKCAVAYRVKNGSILKVFRGLYAANSYWASLSKVEQARHIIRSLGKIHANWVFSHATAALVYNLDVPFDLHLPIHFETKLSANGFAAPNLKHHRITNVVSTTHQGISVSPIEQTVIDCAATYPLQQSLPIVDSALHQGLTNKERLNNYLAQRPNKRGVRKAARAVKYASGLADNGGESAVRAVMIACNLPLPELQVPVENPERAGHYYYVDFMFTRPDGTKIAVELDGKDKYRNQAMLKSKDTLDVFMNERQREAALTAHGIRVARFSFQQAINPNILLNRLAKYGVYPRPSRKANPHISHVAL